MLGVPYATSPWNEIIPGLWQGGHDCNPDGNGIEPAIVGDEFDVVVSLFRRRHADYGPPPEVQHMVALIPDGPLNREDLNHIRQISTTVADKVRDGRKVLVRCQAGYNRSGLVVALALVHMGYGPAAAIDLIQRQRSPYALHNEHFVRYINAAAAALTSPRKEAQ